MANLFERLIESDYELPAGLAALGVGELAVAGTLELANAPEIINSVVVGSGLGSIAAAGVFGAVFFVGHKTGLIKRI